MTFGPAVRSAVERSRSIRRNALAMGVVGTFLVLIASQLLLSVAFPTQVPAPFTVIVQAGQLLATSELWTAVGQTMLSWTLGMALTCAIAIPAGVLIGLSPFVSAITRLPIEFIRPIPPIALLPVAVLVLGTTQEMKLLLIVIGAVWPLLINIIYGVQSVDPVLTETAQVYRFGRLRKLTTVILPSAIPMGLAGLRLSAAIALILAIGAEYVVGIPGLGSAIGVAYNTGDAVRTYALVLLVGFLGLAVTVVLRQLDRVLLSWQPERK